MLIAYKKGFTLFEMMIALALIGLFIVAASYMNRDTRIDQTRAERLSNIVYDQIRTARNNMIIGKWVFSGATTSLIIADERVVTVSSTGVSTNYAYGTAYTGTETRLVAPFFDSDPKYQISDIAISSGSLDTPDMTGVTMAMITYRANGDIIIAASKNWVSVLSSSIRSLRIQTGYGNFSRYVTVDRVSGITEILRLVDSGSTSGIVAPVSTTQPCTLPWGGSTPHATVVTAWLASALPYGSTCTNEGRTCTNWVLGWSYTNSSCSVSPGASCNFGAYGIVPHGSTWFYGYQFAMVFFPVTCATTQSNRSCNNGIISGWALISNCIGMTGNCTFGAATVTNGASVTAYSAVSVTSPATCASVSQTRTCTNMVLSGSYANASCIVVTNRTVTFNANGWAWHTPTTKVVVSWSAIGTLPTNPTKAGSTFNGWYTATTGWSVVSASTTISANVIYYAQWTVSPVCANWADNYPSCTTCPYLTIMWIWTCVPDDHIVSSTAPGPISCSVFMGWTTWWPNPSGSCDGILNAYGKARTIEQWWGWAATYFDAWAASGYGCAFGTIQTYCLYTSPSTCHLSMSPSNVWFPNWNFYVNISVSQSPCTLPR